MIKLAYVTDSRGIDPSDKYLKEMTHISYSFAKMKNKSGEVHENFINAQDLKQFMINNSHVKILLAIGGWGADDFSESVQTDESRMNFVTTSLEILKKYNMDGIDLDWEYPGSSEANITSHSNDKMNFTKLAKLFREKLNELSKKTNKKYSITFACGATPTMLDSYDFKALNELCDFMNLMTYDMGGSFNTTGFHSNIYPSSITKQLGGAYYVDKFSDAGFAKEKIVYGCGFYGRGGSGLSNYFNNNGLNEYIYKEEGFYMNYQLIEENIKKYNLEVFYDEQAVASYIYFDDKFVSFDSERTIKEKMNYVTKEKLGGIMFWEHCTDPTRKLISQIINYEKDVKND